MIGIYNFICYQSNYFPTISLQEVLRYYNYSEFVSLYSLLKTILKRNEIQIYCTNCLKNYFKKPNLLLSVLDLNNNKWLITYHFKSRH